MANRQQHNAYPGTFITLEGVDGSGKSTQAKLLGAWLREQGFEVVELRDPGSTTISERIREILLDPTLEAMSADCELMLYEAARAQLVRERIEPALEQGCVVVCDRFYDSTVAYQAFGHALDRSLVDEANKLGSCGFVPDLTLVFDIDPEVGWARAAADHAADRMEAEGLALQRRVRAGYVEQAVHEPARVQVVDATGAPAEVAARVQQLLAPLLAHAKEGAHA